MKMRLLLPLLCSSLLVWAGTALASNVNAQLTNTLTQKLAKSLKLTVKSVEPSAIDGLYLVVTDSGLFYTNADGSVMMDGHQYQLNPSVTDLTAQRLGQYRVNMMEQMADKMIVYPASQQQYVVTIFTDITCPYCHKLHANMKKYNDLGITVRYMAYPRQGLGGKVQQQMANIWCAADPNKAMTEAMKGATPANVADCHAPIAEQYTLGRSFGVSGTPAMVLEDGQMVPGYLPPKRLLTILKQQQPSQS